MSPKVSDEYKERKRKEIILHAKEVFKRKGFEPTTMKDIKEEAGISFGGLYMYFSNTEKIFLQLLELEYGQNDILDDFVSTSIWDHVKHFIDCQKKELRTIHQTIVPISYEYFITAWREKHRIPFLEHRYKTATTKITALLQAGVESGEFTPAIPVSDLSKLIVSALEGLNVSCLFLQENLVKFEAQLDSLQKVLELALQVQKTQQT